MSATELRLKRSVFVSIAGAILLVIAGLSYRQVRQYSVAGAREAQTREIVHSLDGLLFNLVDAETGQRGFLLTGENRYLDPYYQAIQSIPAQVGKLNELLILRPNESRNISRLKDLVDQKLSELRTTISLRKTQGLPSAVDVVLSDQSRRTMDEIRSLAAEIQDSENLFENQASQNWQAAAQVSLLATIVALLILLFLFAVGFDPIPARDPTRKSWSVIFGTAIVATIAATLARLALTPLIGPTDVPFITFFPAVLFSAWYGGFRAGMLSILLSALVSDYYFVEPIHSIGIHNRVDQIALLIFIVVGFGMTLLSHSQRRAVERASHEASLRRSAELAERAERRRFETTLASIGDAVIATDAEGHVSFMNNEAESLTGWKQEQALGGPLEGIFKIIDEETRQPTKNPAQRAMQEGRVVGLGNHTVLIAKDGTETPIDDSGSAIRGSEGDTIGAVVTFRNIAERRQAEKERELLAEQARMLNSGFNAIVVRDDHDRIISWNRVAEQLYGWTAQEALDQVSHALFKTRFPKPLAEITQDLHREGHWEGELIHTRKDGALIPVLSHWILDRDAQGNPKSVLQINIDISEQKRAEGDLREQREWLQGTLSSIGDAVIATDRNGVVTFLNPVAESLTGWKDKDAIGSPLEKIFNIVNEKTRQTVENPALQAIRDGIVLPLANHTILIARDGSERPIDDAGSPIRDGYGKTLGAVLIFRDITERRRIELAQAELLDRERKARENEHEARIAAQTAELRLQLALEAGRMGTWQYNIPTGEIVWSHGLAQIHGYKPGSSPETFDEFQDEVHPHDRETVLRSIRETIEKRHDYAAEYRIVRKDAAIRWMEARGRLFLDADGNPSRIIGICADITDRKQAEERFRLAVEAAPAAMIMVDSGGTIVLANTLAEQLLGYAKNEIVGMAVESLVPGQFRRQHLEFRRNYLAGASQRPMGVGRDLYAVRKDGSEVAVEIGLSPIQTADGMFIISAITDITERKRVAEAERQARRQAEEASRSKDEFLAMLSHELRSPLTAILGWAIILKGGQMPPQRAQQAFEVIERNARLEAQLVESLLDLSRIVAGKLKLDVERVDLSAIVQNVVDSLRPAANAKGVTLDLSAQPGPVAVIGDAGRLQQIFSNLVTNAVKFTPNAGHVRVRVTRDGSQAQIQVIDDGEGIDPDILPHIFDRFRQAESGMDRAHGGLGLGLAIVRELVQAHGGAAIAESQGKGHGSTFTVTLPVPAVVPAHIESADNQSQSAEEPSISGLRVLVVDDDADTRELVAATLESRGVVTALAPSTAEALDSVNREEPDVMIADIGMPHEDGYVLIQKLRSIEREQAGRHLPAIALTAYASDTDRDQALAAGYDLHLTKPVAPSELTHAIAQFRRKPAA